LARRSSKKQVYFGVFEIADRSNWPLGRSDSVRASLQHLIFWHGDPRRELRKLLCNQLTLIVESQRVDRKKEKSLADRDSIKRRIKRSAIDAQPVRLGICSTSGVRGRTIERRFQSRIEAHHPIWVFGYSRMKHLFRDLLLDGWRDQSLLHRDRRCSQECRTRRNCLRLYVRQSQPSQMELR
jgi:hypothetical protein